jgi:TPR repeat protein
MSSRTSLRRLVLTALVVAALVLPGAVRAAEANRYALLVGVLEYDHDKLPNLGYTENDVEELAELLKRSGFKVILLTSTRGKAREARRPTAQNIRAALKHILDRVTKHDTVLVGLAGHGLQLKVKRKDASGKEMEVEEAFFCPSNARPRDTTDPRVLGETLIPLSELFKNLDDSGAGVKLMLVDACRNDPTLGRNVDTDSLPRPPRGTAALFSCKGGERAFESPKLGSKGHGVFFHYVLEGLRGEARNRKGNITWDALAEYVKDKVSDEVPVLVGGGARQTPQEIKNLTGKSPILVNPTGGGAGSTEADKLFRLALEHELGKDRKCDLAEAIRCYQQAADKGHPLAMATLGLFHGCGVGMKQDAEKARTLCSKALPPVKEAAQKGDVAAQVLLANMLFEGLGVEKDMNEATRWYRQAAEKGNAEAQTSLGDACYSNLGAMRDYQEAVRWYRLAADQGDALGQCRLGWMYKIGAGVNRDLSEAMRWFHKSAERDCVSAQVELGTAYATGVGAEKSTNEAVKWYRRAAEAGDTPAQNSLGLMYSNALGVPRDDREALKWFRMAAEQDRAGRCAVKWWYRQLYHNGQAAAQYNLGWSYENGRGAARDVKEAAKWYRQSAEKHYPLAQFSLGWLHQNGWGVERDDREAVKWYRPAAAQGNANAQNWLGFMYHNGRGVGKDDREAVKWYRLAANQGQILGQLNLGWMLANGLGVDRDDVQAVQWYRLSAERGNAIAQYNLGWMHANGRGVPRNLIEARKWYQKSAAQGNEIARKMLASLK